MKKSNEKANFSTMTKTKEEIIKHVIGETAFKLSGNLLPSQIEQIMEIYGSQCRKEGFEEFRVKAEEGVKKMRHDSVQFGHIELIAKVTVLTTIKEIKQ
jgi:hypothetical protein